MVDGLCHVAKRMEWYMLLHTLLLEETQPSISVRDVQHAKLRVGLKKSIQELYSSLLLYEMQCFCYCHRDSHRIYPNGRIRFPTGTRLGKTCGFLDYTIKFWHKHFRLCQSLNGTSFQDVGDEFIPHYVSLFIPGDHAALGRMFSYSRNAQRPFHAEDIDLARDNKMFDAALWLDHIRLLVYDLGHNKCANNFLLHSAAAQNAVNCVQYLAAIGHDINGQDETGATALCFAARNRSAKTMSMLLDYKADVNLSEEPQKRPLSYFEPRHDLERLNLVRRLVSQGADLSDTIMTTVGTKTTMTTMTPLAWAAEVPYPSTLAHGESIRRLDRDIQDKLSASGLEKMADLLQQLNLLELEEFLEASNTSLVKFLLDHGADINGVDPSWSSDGHGLRRPMTALETLVAMHQKRQMTWCSGTPYFSYTLVQTVDSTSRPETLLSTG